MARQDLQALFARILVSLERTPAARWMGESRTIEADIAELLHGLPDKIGRLRYLASKTSAIGSG